MKCSIIDLHGVRYVGRSKAPLWIFILLALWPTPSLPLLAVSLSLSAPDPEFGSCFSPGMRARMPGFLLRCPDGAACTLPVCYPATPTVAVAVLILPNPPLHCCPSPRVPPCVPTPLCDNSSRRRITMTSLDSRATPTPHLPTNTRA